MDKIKDFFSKCEEMLIVSIMLFIVGILTCFIGCLVIACLTAIALKVFGGIVTAVGVVLVVFGFASLISYLTEI